ncbi:response regulator transcription factor [Cryobacterium lactosi]|uniref:Response regulator transcription factor n=1 Tax=Cryobacterium lactosi TaxID=1259202 RepID=A0A4R9BWT9_9MICO|nr:response regulator transcription factor [Cryobacterium lactosi]TFD93262.1 response regulator transcription factor [Cryobacterium lactosi]
MAAVDAVTRVRIVLVDDEVLVRTGLRLILEGHPELQVVGEAGDGRAGMLLIAECHPDVILMDIRMPHLDGLAATRELLARQPDLKIIVLTTFDTDELVLTALRLGASGFLLKDTPPAELIDGVRQVAAGRTALSQPVIAQLIQAVAGQPERQVGADARARLDQLTARERDVAVAIAQGLSNAEIALAQFVSVTTVKTHVGRILDKLAVANRVQIAICVHTALN